MHLFDDELVDNISGEKYSTFGKKIQFLSLN
jgi:hypothetical protein